MKALPLALALLLLAGCRDGVRGSGTAKTESRAVADFDEISVSSGIQAEVKVGAKGPVELRGDDNLLPLVETDVTGRKLRIRLKPGTQLDPSSPIRAVVLAPDAKALDANSGAKIDASGIDNAACSVKASSGASLEAKGTTGALDAHASSGAKLNAGGLAAKSVNADASSGASLDVSASDAVSGAASSGASIRVKGSPAKRDVSSSSGGSVRYE